jgi:hypothetical protein
MNSLIAVLFLLPPSAGMSRGSGENEVLLEVLRDAQIANREALKSGHLHGSVEYSFDRGARNLSIDLELDWKGELLLAAYAVNDPTHVLVPKQPHGDYDPRAKRYGRNPLSAMPRVSCTVGLAPSPHGARGTPPTGR